MSEFPTTTAKESTMCTATVTTAQVIHPFEAAGLGLAPFRFAGFEIKTYQACHGAPIQPGSSCDYCANAIMNCYWIRSADGKRFKVGCDCVMRLNRLDNRLISEVERAKRVHDRTLSAARRAAKRPAQDARVDAARQLLAGVELRARLAAKPHPYKFADKSLLDYCLWMLENAGLTGRLAVAKLVEEA
jgi:hypothetical protein